jgi:hypothetical protein
MDRTVENNSQIQCEDELALQRLLDEELDADASELVFHHLKGCPRCSAAFQELKESKTLCEEELGREDEVEAPLSRAALLRVRNAIARVVMGQPSTSISKQLARGNGKGHFGLVIRDAGAIDARSVKKADRLRRIRDWLQAFNLGVLLQPKWVTSLVTIVIVVSLFIWLRTPTTVSAAELLARSAAADDAIAAHSDQVLRRTINLETRIGQTASLSDAGNIALRRRIEIWQSVDTGLAARRLFDDKDRLLAGEWKKADGSRLVYQDGIQPQLQPASDRQPGTLLVPGTIWLLNVSAKDFIALIGNPTAARVAATASTYVVSYEGQAKTSQGLIKAKLVLSKADLHTIEQTLLVNFAGDSSRFVEYRFAETSFERRTPNTVAPAVFEPDPVVLAAMKGKGASSTLKPEGVTETAVKSDTEALAVPPVSTATAELEVEVLEKLNRANAFLGEQLSLTRSADGKLLVSGFVETSERKSEILRSLGDVTSNPAVRIDLNTVAEAQRRQKPTTSGNVTIQSVEVTENNLPVDSELRSYFSRAGFAGEQLENQIEQLSRKVLGHSSRARSHALALKQIAERFSPADIETMDPAARTRWRALMMEHANIFHREMDEVRLALAPMFPLANGTAPSDIEIASDQDMARGAKHLFEISAVIDNGLRASLSLSSERGDAPVRSPQFWSSFNSAQALAARIVAIK